MSQTYEFPEECGNFELTWTRQVVSSTVKRRTALIPTPDELIFWTDTADFNLPVTVAYDVRVSSAPHSLIGYFRDLKSTTNQLGWRLSTEPTDPMFFDDLDSNSVSSVAAGPFPPLAVGQTYSVKVVIAADKAELYVDDSLYYSCALNPE